MCIFGIMYGKILKNGVIRAGVKGAGVKKGPAKKGPIRYTNNEKLMYGARDYLAYLGYGAMRLFQDDIIRGHVNFWSRK